MYKSLETQIPEKSLSLYKTQLPLPKGVYHNLEGNG